MLTSARDTCPLDPLSCNARSAITINGDEATVFAAAMVDTIIACTPAVGTLDALESCRYTWNPAIGQRTMVGKYRSLTVRQRSDGETAFIGSLPRFFNGSNVCTMTAEEVRDAIRGLAGAFDIDPGECKVYRLDLAATLSLTRRVVEYLPLLGPLPRGRRTIYEGTGIQYLWKNRTVSVYDKGAQSGEPGNLLRFEVQFKKRVKAHLKLAQPLTLLDLTRPDTMAMVTRHWQRWYERIPKVRAPMLTITPSVKELDAQLAQFGLQEVGLGNLLAYIDAAALPRDAKSRLRARARERATGGACPVSDARIRELDEAVSEAIRYVLEV